MNNGKVIFSQIIDFLPLHEFRKCVKRYQGDNYVKSFSCLDQFLLMAFAQLTYRESLRDIEVCLRSVKNKLYHMGIRGNVSKSTLADANERRDWRIYADFAQVLISIARPLYHDEEFGVELKDTVYALDSTMIDLCLSLFPWSKPINHRRHRGSIKLHTLLDLKGNIPTFVKITNSVVHDTSILDDLVPEPGSFYIMDRGYIDYGRLYVFSQSLAYFVIRAKKDLSFRRVYSHPVDKSKGLRCDQTIMLSSERYPDQLRRIHFIDQERGNKLTFLTNHFLLPPLTICDLYKSRWQIELFFKWIKQHLRIKSFYGTSPNAVKTQIWIAISTYVLVAIIKKKLKLELNLYTILQILSLTLFEKDQLLQVLMHFDYNTKGVDCSNQLELFNL